MKLKNLSILVLLAALTFSFASCGDDDDDNDNGGGNNGGNGTAKQEYYYLPTEYKVIDSNTCKLEYDSFRRLTKYVEIREMAGAEEENTTEITYNSNGTVSGLKETYVDKSGTDYSNTTFRYKNDSIFKTSDYNNLNPKTDTIIITKDGFIKEYLQGYGKKINFTYDAQDRVIQVTDQQNESISDYTYDSKNGVLSDINLPQWLLYIVTEDDALLTKNNYLTENNYSLGNVLESKRTATYTYNEDGFPIKLNFVYEDKVSPTEDENYETIITYQKIAK